MDTKDPLSELDDVFDELEVLLKNPDIGGALAEKGVNISLALVAAEGLRAYAHGDKVKAQEEFDTVMEEIRARMNMRSD